MRVFRVLRVLKFWVFLYKHLNVLMIWFILLVISIYHYLIKETNEPLSDSIISTVNETEAQPADAFKFVYRIRLDVKLDAPIIFVPLGFDQPEAMLLDCGSITVKTNLDILKKLFQIGKDCLEWKAGQSSLTTSACSWNTKGVVVRNGNITVIILIKFIYY